MKKQKTIIAGIIILAIILMAVGYAALSGITLTINGTASATAKADNFKVYFTGNATKSKEANVETSITAKAITATVNISGLTTIGDSEYAILEIENGSNAIDAESVQVKTSGTDTSIIDVEVQMCDSTGKVITDYAVASGAKTYVKVSATLLKTPTSDVSTSITATIEATPKAAQ